MWESEYPDKDQRAAKVLWHLARVDEREVERLYVEELGLEFPDLRAIGSDVPVVRYPAMDMAGEGASVEVDR